MSEYRTSIHDAMECARNKSGINGWRGFVWKRVDNGCLVEGCVPDGVYSKGSRKGEPRFSKPIKGTRKTIIITDRELQDFAASYELSEGVCFECKGTGEVFKRWHHIDGTTNQQCKRCNGTGAPA